jgi:hypothetical protein
MLILLLSASNTLRQHPNAKPTLTPNHRERLKQAAAPSTADK